MYSALATDIAMAMALATAIVMALALALAIAMAVAGGLDAALDIGSRWWRRWRSSRLRQQQTAPWGDGRYPPALTRVWGR